MMVIDNNGATKNTITDYVEDLHDLQKHFRRYKK